MLMMMLKGSLQQKKLKKQLLTFDLPLPPIYEKVNEFFCQALVQVQAPVPTDTKLNKSPQKRKKEGFGPWADTKSTSHNLINFYPPPEVQQP